MLTHLHQEDAELSVLLTDDRRIHELNLAHRGKDRPTDVLAFPLMTEGESEEVGGTRLLGDVIISLDTAGKQARGRGSSLMDEVVFLLAHGLLHLLGYDHQTDAQDVEMTRLTKDLVRVSHSSGTPGPAPRR